MSASRVNGIAPFGVWNFWHFPAFCSLFLGLFICAKFLGVQVWFGKKSCFPLFVFRTERSLRSADFLLPFADLSAFLSLCKCSALFFGFLDGQKFPGIFWNSGAENLPPNFLAFWKSLAAAPAHWPFDELLRAFWPRPECESACLEILLTVKCNTSVFGWCFYCKKFKVKMRIVFSWHFSLPFQRHDTL